MARRLRADDRTRLALLVAVSAQLFVGSPAIEATQSSSSYAELVSEYIQGGAASQKAVLDLAALPQPKVTAMIEADARFLPEPRQRAAVMLHTDTAYAQLLAGLTSNGLFQIMAARRVVAVMKAGGRGNARTQALERRWYAFAVSLLTSNADLDRADFMVRDALSLYPREARLYVARGVLQEMRIAAIPVDQRSGNQIARHDRELEKAATDYRRAIGFDPMLANAHIRLGWIHLALRDSRAAENFDQALVVAAEPIDRYLAHLMRGGLAERESRFDAALVDYEAARAICPTCQTPFIALARIETALGHTARAHEIATALAALAERTNDPWWDFHLGGFDSSSLIWLRTEATAP